MAALEVLSAWADVDKAVLGEVFNVTVTVQNTSSSDVQWAYFILTIDGTTAYMTRGDGFNIGKGKTLTQVFEFPKYDYPKEWTTVMQGVRSSPMYVQASDGYTISEALNIANFEWIDAYYDPQIVQFEAERTPTDESESAKIAIKVSHADGLTDAQIGRLSCELMAYAKDGSTSYNMTIDKTVVELVAGVEITISEDTYKFGKDDDYGLTLSFGDYSEGATASIDLEHSFANLHLSGCSTGGACFGGFCKSTEGNPMLECYYPAYFYGGIMQGGVKDYSTEQIDTGVKWVDGKTIYRKVIIIDSPAKGTNQLIDIGASGTIDKLIRIWGMGISSTGAYPMPTIATSDNNIVIFEGTGNPVSQVFFYQGKNRGITWAFGVVEYTLA